MTRVLIGVLGEALFHVTSKYQDNHNILTTSPVDSWVWWTGTDLEIGLHKNALPKPTKAKWLHDLIQVTEVVCVTFGLFPEKLNTAVPWLLWEWSEPMESGWRHELLPISTSAQKGSGTHGLLCLHYSSIQCSSSFYYFIKGQ